MLTPTKVPVLLPTARRRLRCDAESLCMPRGSYWYAEQGTDEVNGDAMAPAKRTAFVLSGGASLGAIQAGMLQALYERQIAPDLIVGTSVGALNAAYIASRPQTVATAEEAPKACGDPPRRRRARSTGASSAHGLHA